MTEAAPAQVTRVAPTGIPMLPPKAYAQLFDEFQLGKDVLEELIRKFSRPAKREGGIDAVIETYHRAGARSVVEFIVSRINAANGVPEDVEPTAE